MPRGQLRIVFFADTHLGFDYPIRPKVQMRRRGEDFFRNFQRVLDFAVRTRPDLVIHGGDLFFRSRVAPRIVDLAYEALRKFSESNIPFLIVPGNHERSILPASLWLSAANVQVIDRPSTRLIEVAGAKVAVAGFPFVREGIRQQFGSILAATGWQEVTADVKLLLMHQTVEGARVGPSGYTFRSGADVVKMSAIPRGFVAVLSGHIHRRQILHTFGSRGGSPVVYPGSIERTSFAEKDEPKGFYEIMLGRDRAGHWAVQGIEFVPLPTRPMIDLEIDGNVEGTGLHSHLRQRIANLDPNSIVRLRCKDGNGSRIGSVLTAPFLRSIFPSSMNVQLGAEFFPA